VTAGIACTWLLALACTRATPGYCGGDGGTANCTAQQVCNRATLLCELRDGGSDRPGDDGGDASDGREAGDASDASDAGDASPDLYKGCRGNQDCEASDAGPACVLDGGQCVACVENTDCETTAAPVCTAEHRCVECVLKSDCKTTAAPVCTAEHRCVECVLKSDCKTTAAPACTADNRCVECVVGGDGGDCPAATPVCQANHCFECVESTDCKAGKPICQANHCIECLGNGDCKDATRPICQAQQCRACTADSECPADPGVCMNHKDGHCATPGETIVVQMNASCVATATGPNATIGTAAMPACSMQPLTQLVTANRRLIVVRGTVQASSAMLPTTGGGEISIVGQQSAVIAGGASPGLQLNSAEVYVRSIAFKSSTSTGIRASASVIKLDDVLVDSNMGGGIFLDASQFRIMNSAVTNNGPGLEGAITWGGILINSVLPSGQKLLQRVTVQNNKATGISCIASIDGTGVHASSNMALDIQPGCGFTSCAPVGATCGAP